MKPLFLTLALAFVSQSALASWNEFECESADKDFDLQLDIRTPFPTSSAFRDVEIFYVVEGREENFRGSVTRHHFRSNRAVYSGSSVRLEIDFWPDQAPRWAREYRSTLRFSKVNNGNDINLKCRFTNF